MIRFNILNNGLYLPKSGKPGKRNKNVPLVQNWNNTTTVDGNLLPSRLSHVKMWPGRVAPPTIVAWEGQVWRAEISGCDGDGPAFQTPSRVCFVVTYDLEALPTGRPIIEQRSTQCCCSSAITCGVKVSISTSPTCIAHTIHKMNTS